MGCEWTSPNSFKKFPLLRLFSFKDRLGGLVIAVWHQIVDEIEKDCSHIGNLILRHTFFPSEHWKQLVKSFTTHTEHILSYLGCEHVQVSG